MSDKQLLELVLAFFPRYMMSNESDQSRLDTQGEKILDAIRESLNQPVLAADLKNFDWLPPHKCGLYLDHNAHLDVYETVQNYYESGDFVSSDEWDKAVKNNNVWSLQWYPDTPVGCYRICASSLETLIAEASKESRS